MGQLLIDEHLVFDENNFLLFRVDAANEEPLRLGAIASRCLAMLLRSGGSVVRKRELMAGAWGQYGLEVTDNSLAQVVRQLRLALEKLQPDREFIQTLPRIGYKLADGVTVEELTAHPKPALPSCTMVTGNEAPCPLSLPYRPSLMQREKLANRLRSSQSLPQRNPLPGRYLRLRLQPQGVGTCGSHCPCGEPVHLCWEESGWHRRLRWNRQRSPLP
ncbi:winged helix-turn-helix domain-containing protein [Pseudomonas sp. S2_F03]